MKTRTNYRGARAARGFSLLELTLVLVILGILGSVAAINLIGQGDKAKRRATETSMATIKSQIETYILENSTPPATLDTLVAADLLEAGRLNDGWGRPFGYRATSNIPGRQYELWSQGKDVDDTSDNIDVWTMNVKAAQ